MRIAAGLGFETTVVPANGHEHVVFRVERNAGTRLDVYLDGDGRPWINGGRVPSLDPTPVNPLAMRLMAEDSVDSAYIGRPCYFERQAEPACTPDLWTFARYSDEVVASMAAATNALIEAGGYTDVVLIGYSGGGALARLMAPRISHLRGILTVAANLDTDAWTAVHGYLPLVRSLNPARAAPLEAGIVQVAIVGDRDEVVPPSVVDSYVAAGQQTDVWHYPAADHICCWADGWAGILRRFDSRLDVGSP